MSDDEDMFCATPVEISNHRNLDILYIGIDQYKIYTGYLKIKACQFFKKPDTRFIAY